jgi:hypothetical protein
MPQFDSGAAKQIGRFSEGLLLRLLQLSGGTPPPGTLFGRPVAIKRNESM